MTARRALGTGLEASARSIRAIQVNLLDAPPGVRISDLDELRARGVLGARRDAPALRRPLKPVAVPMRSGPAFSPDVRSYRCIAARARAACTAALSRAMFARS
ncbi:hypothetical protein GCM10010145_68880 [Streptomyces ruber]|uniref:Uncharacterized protein n=2 Tax=Streptomyces TaxID=1883 RepID=A0A918EZ60_9ACTN|nr:hypothetical protein GCM10010145_68880 [Streptomyces ruber]